MTGFVQRLLALLLLVLAAGVQAAPDCPPATLPLDEAGVRQGMQNARDHGFLWQLEKDGRRHWLYGTLHVAEQAWMFPSRRVLDALRAADQVALELDLADPDIARRLQAAIAADPQAPPLPEAVARRLASERERACVGDALQALRPEMQAITLVALAGRAQRLDPAWGIDGFLAGLARGLGKPVLSLETPEQQIALLVQNDPEASARQVAETLDELQGGRAQLVMGRLARAWADSRLDELERYLDWCDCATTEAQRAFHHRLVDERNLGLAAQLQRAHADGRSLFMAVGSLHMIGPQGLPALLATRGFQVRALLPQRRGG